MLVVDHLTGGYQNYPVIKDLQFTLQAGQITSLIGLNGAGKSTTFKHLIGQLPAFSGRIKALGHDLQTDRQAYLRQLAYIPEQPLLYDHLTLKDHLELIIRSYQLDPDQALARATRYLTQFRLQDQWDWYPAYFSKGMQQKVMLVCALIAEASILIIDEPFIGLDPKGIQDLLGLLKEKVAQGGSVLLSSHVLSLVDEISDQFLVMHEGRLVAQGSHQDLAKQAGLAPTSSLEALYFALTSDQTPLAKEVGDEVTR